MGLLWLNSCHTIHPDVQTILLLHKSQRSKILK